MSSNVTILCAWDVLLTVALLLGTPPLTKLQKNFASKSLEYLCWYRVLIIVYRRLDSIEETTHKRTEEAINADMYVTGSSFHDVRILIFSNHTERRRGRPKRKLLMPRSKLQST